MENHTPQQSLGGRRGSSLHRPRPAYSWLLKGTRQPFPALAVAVAQAQSRGLSPKQHTSDIQKELENANTCFNLPRDVSFPGPNESPPQSMKMLNSYLRLLTMRPRVNYQCGKDTMPTDIIVTRSICKAAKPTSNDAATCTAGRSVEYRLHAQICGVKSDESREEKTHNQLESFALRERWDQLRDEAHIPRPEYKRMWFIKLWHNRPHVHGFTLGLHSIR